MVRLYILEQTFVKSNPSGWNPEKESSGQILGKFEVQGAFVIKIYRRAKEFGFKLNAFRIAKAHATKSSLGDSFFHMACPNYDPHLSMSAKKQPSDFPITYRKKTLEK